MGTFLKSSTEAIRLVNPNVTDSELELFYSDVATIYSDEEPGYRAEALQKINDQYVAAIPELRQGILGIVTDSKQDPEVRIKATELYYASDSPAQDNECKEAESACLAICLDENENTSVRIDMATLMDGSEEAWWQVLQFLEKAVNDRAVSMRDRVKALNHLMAIHEYVLNDFVIGLKKNLRDQVPDHLIPFRSDMADEAAAEGLIIAFDSSRLSFRLKDMIYLPSEDNPN